MNNDTIKTHLKKLRDHIAALNSVKCSAGRSAMHLMPHLRLLYTHHIKTELAVRLLHDFSGASVTIG